MNRFSVALWALVLLVLVGCNQGNAWRIDGSVSEADGDTIFLKQLVDNQYQIVDQKVLKADGHFSFKLPEKDFAEFYFVQINNAAHVVVVRDSSDRVELVGTADKFEKAEITGSKVSERIQDCSEQVKNLRRVFYNYQNASDEKKEDLAQQLTLKYQEVKEFIGKEIIKDPKSLYAYYALYQRIDKDNLLFSPFVNEDYRYFAAVATSYDAFRPDDPRTKALHEMVMLALKERRKEMLKQMVADAPDVVPDIKKNDIDGVERKLSDYADKIVVLNFWMSQSEDAQKFNEQLKPIYTKYHRSGLEIFQVSSDQSKLIWEEAVKSAKLPWVSVCDCDAKMDQDFLTYNVQRVPTTFLIGRNGKMINRFESAQDLEKAIKKEL